MGGWAATHPLRPEQMQGCGPTCGHRGFLQPSRASRRGTGLASRAHGRWAHLSACCCTQDPGFTAVGRPVPPQPQHPAWGFLLDSVQVVPRVAGRSRRLVDSLAVSSPRPGFQKHQGRSAPARVSISACASISQLLEHRASSSLQAVTESYDMMIDGRWVQRELESMSPPEASLLGAGPCLGAGNAGQPRPAGPTDPPTFSDRCHLNSLLCLSKWASGKILLRKKE